MSRMAQSFDFIWVKVFKNGPSKICGRQPLKIFLNFFRDIKRDIAKKLEKLEKRTQKAIVEIIRKCIYPHTYVCKLF